MSSTCTSLNDFYHISAWTCILFSQIVIISSQSGRRSDQYNHVEEEASNINKGRINIENIKGIESFSSIQKPSQTVFDVDGHTQNHSISVYKRKQKSIKNINLAKIKNLLPYVILKRAYAKLKQKQGKQNKKKNNENRKNKALNEKSRHQSPSHERLIDSLCKQSSGTSICKLVSKNKKDCIHLQMSFLFNRDLYVVS